MSAEQWAVEHPGIGVLHYDSEDAAHTAAGSAGQILGPVDAPTSSPTKAELAQQALLYTCLVVEAKTRAEAARAQLDAIARDELARDGAAPTWRIPGVGTVPLAMTQDAVDVVDEPAYTAWVASRYPTEVETFTRVRPVFDRRLRDEAAQRGAACDDQGEVIPGLLFRAGGLPRGVSIRPAAAAKTATLQLAAQMLDAVVMAALEAHDA